MYHSFMMLPRMLEKLNSKDFFFFLKARIDTREKKLGLLATQYVSKLKQLHYLNGQVDKTFVTYILII